MFKSAANRMWYELNRVFIMGGCLLGWSLRVEGGGNVPSTGPVLLLANHQSFLDPMMIGVSCSRQLVYLARKTLFRGYFGKYITSVGAVPVDQEGVAKEGLKTIITELKQDRAVLVFPEGERCWTGKMQALKPGISLLINRAPAPIVPVGIAGAFEAYPRMNMLPKFSPLLMPATNSACAITFGKVIDPKTYENMPREQMLNDVFERIHDCYQQAEKIRRKW